MCIKNKAKKAGMGAALIAATTTGFVLNERSNSNLDVCPPLKAVTELAAKRMPVTDPQIEFMVIDGFRTDEEHAENIRKGVTWVRRSVHQDGMAVDVVAIVNDEISWNAKHYPVINKAFQAAAKELNTPLIWGGDWKVRDWGHFELKVKVCYPEKTKAEA